MAATSERDLTKALKDGWTGWIMLLEPFICSHPTRPLSLLK